LALQVSQYAELGDNPEVDPTYTLIQVHAIGGRVTWQDELTAEVTTLEVNHAAKMVDMQTPVVTADAAKPDWLDSRNMRLIDRDASEQLEPHLVLNRPLSVSLKEQDSSRLVEVRSLAISSLGLFGEFHPFVDALNDRDLHSYWANLVESLRVAMARNPRSATRIRTTFERLRGKEGSELYRVLCGFSPEQLAEDGASRLVELLNSDSMDLRVVAFETLRQITQKTNGFRAERDPSQQKGAIVAWNKALNNGEIVYKTPPSEQPQVEDDAAAPKTPPSNAP
jgi:hypothetical protein